jgi:alkylation response protein AidB-like acyl-CoA dehydrogenase
MAVADEKVREITRDELVTRVSALAPLVRERADEAERNRFVPEDVVRAMGETGLYMIHQWLIGLFPIEAQEDVWSDHPGAITAGSYAPAGQCVRVDGGFRITGSWAYASGCDHADWGLMGVFLPPKDGDGQPVPGFVIAPRSDFTIDDTWDTIGLAATGSKNMVCEDVFVPEHRHVTFQQLGSGNAPGYQAHQSALFRYPLLSLIAYTISTPALGCLQGAIDDFREQTKARETRGAVVAGGAKVAQFQSVQMRIGHAAAALKAGRAMLFEQLEDSRRKVVGEGQLLDTADRQDNRTTQAYTVQLALQGMEQLWGATGGAGIQRSQYVQRAWRDAHAVAHHVSFNWDALSSMYGQYLLGLEPQGQY